MDPTETRVIMHVGEACTRLILYAWKHMPASHELDTCQAGYFARHATSYHAELLNYGWLAGWLAQVARSRKWLEITLQNEYQAKLGFDTEENEPPKS